MAAGPPPLPPAEDEAVIEVDRAINNSCPVNDKRPTVSGDASQLRAIDGLTRHLIALAPGECSHGRP